MVLHEGHTVVPAGNWVPQFLQNMGFLSLGCRNGWGDAVNES